MGGRRPIGGGPCEEAYLVYAVSAPPGPEGLGSPSVAEGTSAAALVRVDGAKRVLRGIPPAELVAPYPGEDSGSVLRAEDGVRGGRLWRGSAEDSG